MDTYHTIVIHSTELDMIKRVYVYVPNDYDTSDERYPVLYMHDGQNLFDDKLAFMKRGWRIPEVYHNNPDLPKLIIVGIESDGTRSDQLIPYPFTYKRGKKVSGGKADQYLSFICDTVKPLIDTRYRTKTDPKNTAMMGSSFGGVNCLYAALTKGHVFSKFASLSGAFHFSFFEPLMAKLKETNLEHIDTFYMDTGTKETDDTVENKRYLERNDLVANALEDNINNGRFRYDIIPDAIHHETAWQERFADIIRYIFQE